MLDILVSGRNENYIVFSTVCQYVTEIYFLRVYTATEIANGKFSKWEGIALSLSKLILDFPQNNKSLNLELLHPQIPHKDIGNLQMIEYLWSKRHFKLPEAKLKLWLRNYHSTHLNTYENHSIQKAWKKLNMHGRILEKYLEKYLK